MAASTHSSFDKLIALQDTLGNRDPFYSGACAIPEFQRFLYYIDGNNFRRIDLSDAGPNELGELYRACKPAKFGQGGETVLDESYRKAGEMDLISFATTFDPRGLGIHHDVSKALLHETYPVTMDMELYKLNVYGPGDFFKPHKDTPWSQDMFGSLVVVLPAPHEGGQFALRKDGNEWDIDFADKLAATTEPSAFFVAFYSDVEHEVLPVTNGYRVTLTYNLYHKPTDMYLRPSMSSLPTPYHQKLKQTLVNLVNDESVLPKGGYLGFGLAHEYVYTEDDNVMEPLFGQLKGSDRALAAVCNALGLRCFLRLLYRGICGPAISNLNLLTTRKITLEQIGTGPLDMDDSWDAEECLGASLGGLTIDQVEGIHFVGEVPEYEANKCGVSFTGVPPGEVTKFFESDDSEEDGSEEDIDIDPDIDPSQSERPLKCFYRDPVTEVLEVTPMKSSVEVALPCMAYGNEAYMKYYYGTACMLIAVGPAESRKFAGL